MLEPQSDRCFPSCLVELPLGMLPSFLPLGPVWSGSSGVSLLSVSQSIGLVWAVCAFLLLLCPAGQPVSVWASCYSYW